MHWDHVEYGETWAEIYDEVFSWVDDTGPSVRRIAQIAGAGEVLELGAGTGRVALPLAQQGIDVHALEVSGKMIRALEAKAAATGASLTVHQADMCEFDLGKKFAVVFMTHNTLSALATQDEQMMCVSSAARHLRDDGTLIIDQGIPSLEMLVGDGTLRFTRADQTGTWLLAHKHNWPSQQVISQRIRMSDGNTFCGTIKGRYLWPSEMDLMARLSGLRLTERWSDWNDNQFTSESRTFISNFRLDT
jgi:SAM-dependent methyltransferase